MSGRRPLRAGDELVVSRLDDLAPSLEDLSVLLRRSQARGVRLRFEEVAASAHEARLLVAGILLAADFQARVSAERLKAEVVRARESGVFRPGRRRTLSPERVAELRSQGLGAADIARELGVARQSVYRKLREIEAPETRRIRRRGARPGVQPLVR